VILNGTVAAAAALRPHIRALVAAYEDTFDSHDPAAVSAFFTEDADIVVRNSAVIHGRQAILDWWRTYFSQPRPYRTILIVDEIRMISPAVALINVIGTGAGLQADAEPLPVRYTRATWVVIRQEGDWLIAALRVLLSEDDRLIRGGWETN
jgi:uncharacterized protein (TIGR02246 family)